MEQLKEVKNVTIIELQPNFDNAKSFYEKAYMVFDDKKVTLYSYNTQIANIEFNMNKFNLVCKEKHLTMTTLRHLKEFLRVHHLEDIANLTKKEIIKNYL